MRDDGRRFARIDVSLAARVSVAGESTRCRCTNLSRGGAFLRTRRLLPENTIVELRIGDVAAMGRVVRASLRPLGMGVELVDVADEDLTRLGCPAAEAPAARGRVLEVLIASQRRVLLGPFRAAGDRIALASGTREVLERCLERRPELLICEMPLGAELIPFLHGRLPILCVSESRAARLHALRLGADGVATAHSVRERAARVIASGAALRSLRGDFGQVPLGRLLALLAYERRSGDLLLVGERAARIHLRDGRPLRSLRTWKRGRFEFAPCLCHHEAS
jgi:hypothetical protein